MLNSPKTWLVAISLLITAACSSFAFADGKYFGLATVERDPSIPSQRAIIAWRDGQQKMITESLVEGDGDEFAWIIPLPAVPYSIQPATAGILRTASELITPVVHGKRTGEDWIQGGVTLFVISLPIFFILVSYNGNKYGALAKFGGLLLALLILIGLFLPALGRARGGMEISGVQHVSSQTVGSYEVAVIDSETGEAATRWLNQNGFRYDETATAALEQYSSEGWCFAAARIRKTNDGAMRPHPMMFTFAVDRPTYPMRLTGLTTQPLLLELFVIGDHSANVPNLKQWFSDSFRTGRDSYNAAGEPAQAYKASTFRASVGHLGLMDLMWENCILTHLRGTLTPQQMQSDINIDWTPFKPVRHHVYAAGAAVRRAIGVALIGVAASLFIIGVVRHVTQSWTRGVRRLFVALLGVSVLVAGVSYAQCDVQPVTESRESIRTRSWAHFATSDLAEFIAKNGDATVTIKGIEELLLRTASFVARDSRRFVDTQNIDVPNGFEIKRDGDHIDVVIYDAIGAPAPIRFNAAPPSTD